MAIRYEQKTKDEVVAYVKQFNDTKGRGGQTAAVKKWDLNPITVRSWLEKAGVETPGKGGKKKRKPGRPAKATAAPKAPKAAKAAKATKATRGAKRGRAAKPAKAEANVVEGVAGTLQRMMAIQGEMASLEREFAKLKAKL